MPILETARRTIRLVATGAWASTRTRPPRSFPLALLLPLLLPLPLPLLLPLPLALALLLPLPLALARQVTRSTMFLTNGSTRWTKRLAVLFERSASCGGSQLPRRAGWLRARQGPVWSAHWCGSHGLRTATVWSASQWVAGRAAWQQPARRGPGNWHSLAGRSSRRGATVLESTLDKAMSES